MYTERKGIIILCAYYIYLCSRVQRVKATNSIVMEFQSIQPVKQTSIISGLSNWPMQNFI